MPFSGTTLAAFFTAFYSHRLLIFRIFRANRARHNYELNKYMMSDNSIALPIDVIITGKPTVLGSYLKSMLIGIGTSFYQRFIIFD